MFNHAMLLLALVGPSHSAKRATCCDMAVFASDPTFLAAHAKPALVTFKLSEGAMVSFPDANQKNATGYWVGPKMGAKAAIVMVHEFWGLNDYIKREAERLHDETGYAVLAVDLYEGKTSTDAKEASQLMQNVDKVRAGAIVKGAVWALKSGTFGFKAKKIGSVGYCFGGGWSEQTAIEGGKDVNASVMYYGLPDTSAEAMAKLKAPVLFIRATKDPWINADVQAGFEKSMKDAHKPYGVLDYDADHAFANPSNPHFNQAAAKDAHEREIEWFKKLLG
jgi:carboxymethylenebutenolidase